MKKAFHFSAGKKVQPPPMMNGVYGAQPGPNKFGDVAGIPGSGPNGCYCRSCDFIRHNKNATEYGRCKKAALMRRLSVVNISMIRLTTAACRYFSERSPDDKPWQHRADFAQPQEPKDPVMF